jgi:hypothetical protein
MHQGLFPAIQVKMKNRFALASSKNDPTRNPINPPIGPPITNPSPPPSHFANFAILLFVICLFDHFLMDSKNSRNDHIIIRIINHKIGE